MMYQIIAQVIRTTDGWTTSTGVPIFFLSSEVQGIVNAEHAGHIALTMLQDLAGPLAHVTGTAYNTDADDYITFHTDYATFHTEG